MSLEEHLVFCSRLLLAIRPQVLLSSTLPHYILNIIPPRSVPIGVYFLFTLTNGVGFLPSGRTEIITVICSYSCPVVLTYTGFDPFASIVVFVSISNKAGVDLRYPCVFGTNYMELVYY